VKESSRKGQNQIKTGQKQEVWRSQEMPKAVTVERGRKTEENKKRMNENANTSQKLFKFKEKKKREGPCLQNHERSKRRDQFCQQFQTCTTRTFYAINKYYLEGQSCKTKKVLMKKGLTVKVLSNLED
nr:hypothetical protein [Tanacetum cinerariifolium]